MKRIIPFCIGFILVASIASAHPARRAPRLTAGRVPTTAGYTCRHNTYRSVGCP